MLGRSATSRGPNGSSMMEDSQLTKYDTEGGRVTGAMEPRVKNEIFGNRHFRMLPMMHSGPVQHEFVPIGKNKAHHIHSTVHGVVESRDAGEHDRRRLASENFPASALSEQ